MTDFPYAKDYQAALQNPERAFTRPGLQRATFEQDSWGLPATVAGSSAVVFHAAIGAGSYALRCYTRKEASSKPRYAAFERYVTQHQLHAQVASVAWHDNAVRVKGGTWPVLQMEWIDGRLLDQYAGYLAGKGDARALAVLAGEWRTLIATLQDAEFAHGDLQHGNVLIDQQGRFRLVDFDSVWIPSLAGQPPPTETGHENYQHPAKSRHLGWGRWADTFSALVIYLALAALAKDPGLWLPLSTGENLLFERRDFAAPFDTQPWKHLARLADPEVDRLAGKLQACCAPDWVPDGSLESILAGNWWEQPGVAARSPAPAPRTVWAWSATTGETTGVAAGQQAGRQATSPLPPPPAAGAFQAPTAPQQPASTRPPGPGRTGPAQGERPAPGPWWQSAGGTAGQAPPVPAPPPTDPARRATGTGKPGKVAAGYSSVTLGVTLLVILLAAGQYIAALLIGAGLSSAGVALIRSGRAAQKAAGTSGS